MWGWNGHTRHRRCPRIGSVCRLADLPMDRQNHTRVRTSCWRLTAAVACGFIALAWSESAQATCGDWLVGHAISESNAAQQHTTSTQTAAHDASRKDVKGRSSGRPTCNGPACSRLPDLPLSPSGPAEPVTPISRLQAMVMHGDLPPGSAASWLAGDGPLLYADGPTSRIERPPMRG